MRNCKEINHKEFSNDNFLYYKDLIKNFLLAPSVSLKYMDLIILKINKQSFSFKKSEQFIKKLDNEISLLKASDFYSNTNASNDVLKKVGYLVRKYNFEEDLLISVLKEAGISELIDKTPYPYLIKQKLDKYILGQESLKQSLANTGFVMQQTAKTGFSISNNLMIIGKTGNGKTFAIKIFAKILGLPLTIINSATLVETGIVGTSVGNILTMHYQKCGSNSKKMKRSIIFFDEFDKLADSHYHTVQDELLSLINRDEVSFPVEFTNRGEADKITVDLSKTLFVFAGTFSNLKSLKRTPVGFDGQVKTDNNKIKREDFQKIGIKREIIGRINSIIELDDLSKEDYINIMKSENFEIIKTYSKLLKQSNKTLIISDEVYNKVAELALESNEGARYLNTVFTDLFQNIIFGLKDAKTEEIIIDINMLNF